LSTRSGIKATCVVSKYSTVSYHTSNRQEVTGIATRHQFRQSYSSTMNSEQLEVAKRKTLSLSKETQHGNLSTAHFISVQPSTTLQNYIALNLHSFGMLHRVYRWLVTDVLVRSIGPVCKNKVACLFLFFYLASLTLGNGAIRLSRTVGNQPPINPA
jgi:hypothetical protein